MASVSKSFPLSFAQQRLWLLDRLAPGTPFYNIPAAFHLRGRLDLAAFARSFETIVHRHESLRTFFGEEKGQPVQFVVAPGPFPVPVVDLSALGEARRRQELEIQVRREGQRPFDLEQDDLIRVVVFRLDGGGSGAASAHHAASVVMHHIISDGWSTDVLIRELVTLYEAFAGGAGAATGGAAALPELPIQYVDFAVWQRQWLQGEVLEAELDHWREALAGLPPLLPLPTDRPRPAVQGFRGRGFTFQVPEAAAARLRRLAQEEGQTLFSVLLTAFAMLLSRTTHEEDLAVGAPVAGRNRLEIEGLIGFFVNTLVLRADLEGNPGFREALQRVGRSVVEAYSHQDVPFERLVEELAPDRALAYSPLFQVMFSYQNVALEHFKLSGLELELMGAESGTAKFDLTVVMSDDPAGRLLGSIEYSTDLFDRTTVLRLAEHFKVLLSAIAEDPGRRLASLPLMTPWERAQTRVEWNDTARPVPTDRLLHELFEEQAVRRPEAVAVSGREGAWSYGEVNARANQLAHYLREEGVGPDVPVALFMERAVEMVVGVIAILKAGGAYMGLDLMSPPDRLAFMLEDSATPVLLTQERLLPRLPEGGAPAGYQVLCLDTDGYLFEDQPTDDPERLGLLDHLHALVYTSGSTGQPKGTLATAANYLNLIFWYGDFGHHDESTHSLLHTGLNFDASFRNLFGALPWGGRTVLADDGPYDPDALHEVIRDHGASTTTGPQSVLNPVIERAARDDYRSLSSFRWLHLGGEPTVPPKLRPWLASPHCRVTVTNVYGLTETSDISVAGISPREELDTQETVPVGRPQQNARIYILDRRLEPEPIGGVGEIAIGGFGVTRGFLNRPGLTAARFVPDPWGDGERIYRTGDLGRWLPDGRIEYEGRADHQVKLRGMRLELGEVETQMRSHPEIHEAVAMVRAAPNGDPRLVAWIFSESAAAEEDGEGGVSALLGPEAVPEGLRDYLADRLPEYMVPSLFLAVGNLPLNASGKLDRKRLPEPAWDQSRGGDDHVAPRNETEETLAALCGDLLGLERVSVEDSFFALGGHSLLAMQFISRIRETFRVDLPLQSLFQAPTVAELAELVAQQPRLTGGEAIRSAATTEAYISALEELVPGGPGPAVLVVHGELGGLEAYGDLARVLAERLDGQAPVYGLRHPDRGLLAEPLRSLDGLAAFHWGAVRTLLPSGPKVVVGAGAPAARLAHRVVRAAREAGEPVGLVVIDPVHAPGAAGGGEAGGAAGEVALLQGFSRRLGRLAGREFELPAEEIEALEPEEWPSYLFLRARVSKALPEGWSSDRLEDRWATYRDLDRVFTAAFAAEAEPLPGDGILVRAARTARVDPAGQAFGPTAWQPPVMGELQVVEVEAASGELLAPPAVSLLVDTLEEVLRLATEASLVTPQVAAVP